MSESYFLARGRWRTRAVEWMLYALAWTFRWVTWPIGTWSLSGALAPLGGRLAMAVPGFRRRAMGNLALVWPDRPLSEHRRIARGAAAHFTRLMIEYARLDKFARTVALSVTGQEHLQAARQSGAGAILVTAHFGNWEAARLAALRAGCETGIIYRPFNNRYLDRFTVNMIPCVGAPVLHKGRQGMRDLIAHVSGGGFAMILVDQRNSGAPFLDFLGHPAETVTVAADLALRAKAQLIPAVAHRNVDARRFDVRFEAPIPPSEAGEMMQTVNDRLASWVTAAPEQWFWFHRRWRSTIRSRPRP